MFFRLLVRFSKLHSSHQQDGEANNENLLDRSSLRHLDSPSLSSPRLRAPIVSMSSNSMTHRDPVQPTIAADPLLSFANTSAVPSRRRLGADGDVDGVYNLSVSKPSTTPRRRNNSLLHRPFILTDFRDCSAGARINCKCIAAWLLGKNTASTAVPIKTAAAVIGIC
jgi:hypothetical protein